MLYHLIVPGFILSLWGLLTTILPPFVLPDPFVVAGRIWTDRRIFALDALITLFEALLGLALAGFVAVVCAVAFQFTLNGRRAIMPWAVALKSIPIVAMAPLMVLWIGNGLASKVILASLVCFFPLLVALDDGLERLPGGLRDLCAAVGGRRAQILMLVQLPYGMVQFLSGLKIAAPLSVVGAVVAEYSGATIGLGHRIILSAYRADAAGLLAGTIVCGAVGYFVYRTAASGADRLLILLRAQNNAN